VEYTLSRSGIEKFDNQGELVGGFCFVAGIYCIEELFGCRSDAAPDRPVANSSLLTLSMALSRRSF